MTSRFTATRRAQETANVRDALLRVRQAMTNAQYDPSQYTILAQTYWTPIPRSDGFRYAETGWTRQSVGGCGVWNRDANWAHDTATTIFGPYQLREGSHASYWGQLAMRACLRLAYNGGAVRGGRCVRAANGLSARGEPQVALQ